MVTQYRIKHLMRRIWSPHFKVEVRNLECVSHFMLFYKEPLLLNPLLRSLCRFHLAVEPAPKDLQARQLERVLQVLEKDRMPELWKLDLQKGGGDGFVAVK